MQAINFKEYTWAYTGICLPFHRQFSNVRGLKRFLYFSVILPKIRMVLSKFEEDIVMPFCCAWCTSFCAKLRWYLNRGKSASVFITVWESSSSSENYQYHIYDKRIWEKYQHISLWYTLALILKKIKVYLDCMIHFAIGQYHLIQMRAVDEICLWERDIINVMLKKQHLDKNLSFYP